MTQVVNHSAIAKYPPKRADKGLDMLRFGETEKIHSGHFMVSEFDDSATQDEEDSVSVTVPEVVDSVPPADIIVPQQVLPPTGRVAAAAGQQPQRRRCTTVKPLPSADVSKLIGYNRKDIYDFGRRLTKVNIDGSLTKLFQCMTLAYSGKLTSPKWKNFKGLKLTWKDKIRLNNMIWRAWHQQFILMNRVSVCQFAVPLVSDQENHTKPEAVVLEGKYWKRKLGIVCAEYKKWRLFYKDRTVKGQNFAGDLFCTDINMFDWQGRANQQASFHSPQSMILDDDPFVDFNDTLFSSLLPNQAFIFPNPKDISKVGIAADFIQPGLVPFQPNLPLDDFMDTFTDFSDYLNSSRLPTVTEENDSFLFSNEFESISPQQSESFVAEDSNSQNLDLYDFMVSQFQQQQQQTATLPSSAVFKNQPTQFHQGSDVNWGSTAQNVTQIQSMASDLLPHTKQNSPLSTPVDYSVTSQEQQRQSSPLYAASNQQYQFRQQEKAAPAGNYSQFNSQHSFQYKTECQQQQPSQGMYPSNYEQQQLQSVLQSSGSSRNQSVSEHLTSVRKGAINRQVATPLRKISFAGVAGSSSGGIASNSDEFAVPRGKPRTKCRRASSPGLLQQTKSPPNQIAPNNAKIIQENQAAIVAVQAATQTGLQSNNVLPQNALLAQLLTTNVKSNAQSPPLPDLTAASAANSPGMSYMGQLDYQNQRSTVSRNPVQSATVLLSPTQTIATQDYRNCVLMNTNASVATNQFNATAHQISGPANIAQIQSFTSQSPAKLQLSPTEHQWNSAAILSAQPRLFSPGSGGSPCPSGINGLGGPRVETDRVQYKEHRRVCHINAEQKRRCNIKNGFDTLHHLVPSLSQNPNTKVSKAAMLQKAGEYIKQLKTERQLVHDEADQLKKQIEMLNQDINSCQAQLPATGAPVSRQRATKLREMFEDYVRARTLQNWKFWIFSILTRPFLDSFNQMVSTASWDDLCRTVLTWLEQNCSLVNLRPAVLNSLRLLSTSTNILADPAGLPEEARRAVLSQDSPTGSTAQARQSSESSSLYR